MATHDDTAEAMAVIVRRIVARELAILDEKLALSDDDVDRLAKIALVMQRTRPPARGPGGDGEGAGALSSEQLMRRAEE
jgi:hypothetical protein